MTSLGRSASRRPASRAREWQRIVPTGTPGAAAIDLTEVVFELELKLA